MCELGVRSGAVSGEARQCQSMKTMGAGLRILGLGQARPFEKYRRVLSRTRWPVIQGAII